MKLKTILKHIAFVLLCVFINFFGKLISDALHLPLWLDTVGTVFGACVLGPVCGAMIGATSNIMYSFFWSDAVYYIITNIVVGVMVGVFYKKGFFKDTFGVLSTSYIVALSAMLASVPVNFLISDGNVGNIWGDGMINLLKSLGMKKIPRCIIGEYYVEFLDKTVSVLIFYILQKIRNKEFSKAFKNRKKLLKNIGSVSAAVVVMFSALFCNSGNVVFAEDDRLQDELNLDSYIHTVYNGENGLPGGKANDIVQTKDGVLWIGTYGGLYRYCGNSIKWMNNLESVKTVNCLYTDEAGRLFIGTNDNGLSIYINDRVTNVLNKEDGFPSNSVRCITQSSDGLYYAGTTDSLVVLSLSGGLCVDSLIPEIVYARSICSDGSGNVCVVTDSGTLYLVRGTEIIKKLDSNQNGERFKSCTFSDSGVLYTGSSGNTVTSYEISDAGFKEISSVSCQGISMISSVEFIDDNLLFVCADNGAGYISQDGKYCNIDMYEFNSSIERVLKDYQGNYWFCSSRLGVMCLRKSVFSELGKYDGLSGNVVNTVTKWQDNLYVGTDSGLETIGTTDLQTKLTEIFEGIRIRCFTVDSNNNLWICTSGKGLWRINPYGETYTFDSSVGTAGDKFRYVMELDDKTIVAAGDYGITFINNDKVTNTITSQNGLANPKILCLCPRKDGSILAGTDGNGIAVIRDGRVVSEFKQENGLSSETILRMVNNSDDNGCFVVTGNGLCYIDENDAIKTLDKFPYYNNFDIVEGLNNELFVLSSAGIYVVDKTQLLNGENVKALLLDSKKGLRYSLTPNSWNYIDEDNNLYLSSDNGIAFFNLNMYDIPMRSCRMLLREIIADGVTIPIEKGMQTVIPSGTKEIVFNPEVINFSVNDPEISIYMEGIDKKPFVVTQSKLSSVVYSNISAGEYVFHLAILDGRTGDVLAENTFRLVKEPEFYEHWWFVFYAVVIAVVSIAYFTWLVVRTQIQKTLRMQKMELDFVKNQIKMGNETILTIAMTVDAKDENTSQHSVRVSEYSVMIAKKLGYSEDELDTLHKTAMLHDIGKIGIPDRVLNKPEKLNDEEYAIMKSHVTRGAEILKNFTMIENVSDGALYHHERYDGKGYANGLKGEEIPLNARIIGLADAFDAMTANRVYRKKLDFKFVIEELKKGRGTQFDPKLVDILLELIKTGTIDITQMYGKKISEVNLDEI